MGILSDGTLAEQIVDAITRAGIAADIVVQRTESVDPGTPWDPSDDTTVVTDHTGQGWVDSYDASNIDGSVIQANDRKVFVITSSLDIMPTTTDKVPIGAITYSIVRVSTDPAGAAWVLQCRSA